MGKGAEFHETVPEVKVRGGVAYFTSNGQDHAMELATARALHRKLGAALATHDAGHGVVIAPLRVAHRKHD